MRRFKDFDPLGCPLEGTNLIEASAGTGKTYTLSSLFLRLILEKGLSVNEILVVTFTKAATEELRDRVRRKLRQGMEAFAFESHEDPFLDALVKKHGHPIKARAQLTDALQNFDEAAIFTIHGFCQRTLNENAFETGSLFDTELISNEETLRQEILYDFWRKHFYASPPEFVSYALSKGISPTSFLKQLRKNLVYHDLKIIPDSKVPELTSLASYRREFERLRNAWPLKRETVKGALMDPGLHASRYGNVIPLAEGLSKRELLVSDLLSSMDRMVRFDYPVFPLCKGIEKFSASYIASSMKKGHHPPVNEIFALCQEFLTRAEDLTRQMDELILFLRRELYRFVQRGLAEQKQRLNIRSFDDLMLGMKKALDDTRAGFFIEAAKRNYRAALIDEFQDTDPIQYGIFRALFGTKENPLFLIGDPKQAIYSFRGADLFTYLRASTHVTKRYTLRKNWRCEPGLLASINRIFSSRDRPFVYDQLFFLPSEPADIAAREFLTVDGETEVPFRIWLLDESDGKDVLKPLTKKRAREIIPRAIAAEVSRLLHLGREKRALIGDKPLKEEHIAVLVRKNRDARLLQDALASLRIPCVLFGAGNLFDTREALEMERVLRAVSETDKESLLKGALATHMIGVSGEDLERILADDIAWENVLCRFREYHELWRDKGFLPMFRYLLSRENVRARLLTFPDGERRLTNLLHLSEVLHRESLDGHLGVNGLLKWLSDQRNPDTLRLEEHQLRLESDEEAIKVVTTHKSKGLEYPVVFCPFTWDGSEIADDSFTFHDEKHDLRLTLDLGSQNSEEHKALAARELLAENLRLLYVAVTRAKNRCYLLWGRINGAETSAPAYLFHGPPSPGSQDLVEATGNRFLTLRGDDVVKELRSLADQSEGTFEVFALPDKSGETCLPQGVSRAQLEHRRFSGRILRDWRVSSFSSLISGRQGIIDLPDHDREVFGPPDAEKALKEITDEEVPSGIFAFPRGARAGTFLHDVMEHVDFTERNPDVIKALVGRKLDEYGFESSWLSTILATIKNVLSVQLDPTKRDLKLRAVSNENRLNELEFYFPMRRLSVGRLKEVFAGNLGPPTGDRLPKAIERLEFSPSRGFMKGFMDMVFQWDDRFYLVDWKSNYLGTRLEDYNQGALAKAMEEELYILQYHIYVLALDRYLRMRLPGYRYEQHFGGCYYIFMRGVEPEMGPECGVYGDVPSREVMHALNRALTEEGPENQGK